jgi:hypothetical protein
MRFRVPCAVGCFESTDGALALEEAIQQMIGDAFRVRLDGAHAHNVTFREIRQAQAFFKKLATSFFSPALSNSTITLVPSTSMISP